MRLILLILVVALGIDALYYSGAYTQAAWRELSAEVRDLSPKLAERPAAERPDTATDG